jgi:serine/threonine-protein kinase HipA
MNAEGEWQFAPAYDLTFSYSGYGFHSTMVAGESKNPGRKDLMKLATYFGIKNAKTIIEQVQEGISNWEEIAKESGVSKENRQSITNILDKLKD